MYGSDFCCSNSWPDQCLTLLMLLHVVCIFLRTCSEFTHASADLLYREKVRGAGADALSLEWSRNFKQNAVESLVYSLVRMQASLRHYQVRPAANSQGPVYGGQVAGCMRLPSLTRV